MSHCLSHYAKLVTQTQSTLANIASDFTPAVFASSLAAEDMVLTDLIWRDKLPIGIFSLDTGRLHTATMGMLGRIREMRDSIRRGASCFGSMPTLMMAFFARSS